jgi:hypothetical protein
MAILMGLDQHRAQMTTDWVDTSTGEVSRARVAPADRAGVRRFLARFRGQQLEVALEATTGWRFVVEELHRIGPLVRCARGGSGRRLLICAGGNGRREGRRASNGNRRAPTVIRNRRCPARRTGRLVWKRRSGWGRRARPGS